jgi:hypothetical protein
MASYGVTRSTRDVDILVVDATCLERGAWAVLERGGVSVEIRRAGEDDPLAGAIRAASGHGDFPVDVVVGRERWQREIVDRARPGTVDGISVPVATAADLIVLKLYAAAPVDAWDVEQLLQSGDRPALIAQVDAVIASLPAESQALWARIIRPR